MKIHVRHDADQLYVVTRYLSHMGGRNINPEWKKTLAELQDQWFDVDTRYLHQNSFALIVPGKKQLVGIHDTVFIDQIVDDEREKQTYQAVDYIRAMHPNYLKMYPQAAFKVPIGKKFITWTDVWDRMDWSAALSIAERHLPHLLPFNPADINMRIILETLYGYRFHCRPFHPVNHPTTDWSFNHGTSGLYTINWFQETFPELVGKPVIHVDNSGTLVVENA
jgi:hypothetical protein